MSESLRGLDEKTREPMEPLGRDEEMRLVQACKKGDMAAFETLIERCQDRVYGLAYQLLRDRDDAEDLAQEVFLTLYRSIDRFRSESRLSTWLYRVTVNRAKNRWRYDQRRQKNKHESLDQPVREGDDARPREIADPGAGPRRQAEGHELGRILEEQMAELNPEHREVLHLRFVEELSYEEIAEALECSLGTVKSRINRARGVLREAMREFL